MWVKYRLQLQVVLYISQSANMNNIHVEYNKEAVFNLCSIQTQLFHSNNTETAFSEIKSTHEVILLGVCCSLQQARKLVSDCHAWKIVLE